MRQGNANGSANGNAYGNTDADPNCNANGSTNGSAYGTPTLTPTATSTAAPTATPAATPTLTPTATPTAAPTATPACNADEERAIREKYGRVLGQYCEPRAARGELRPSRRDSRLDYAKECFLTDGPAEKSVILDAPSTVRIEHVAKVAGAVTVLKGGAKLIAGEVLDASMMSVKALSEFYDKEIEEAGKMDILLSLHLKATMMKISDFIFFGHCAKVFYKDLLRSTVRPSGNSAWMRTYVSATWS